MARRILKYVRGFLIVFLTLSSIAIAALAVHSYTYSKDFDWRRGMAFMPTHVFYLDGEHCVYVTSLRGYGGSVNSCGNSSGHP